MRYVVPYAAFTAFGVFWGTWGAALPALRDQAGVSQGELGTALLFVGVGALPAMLLTGRAMDRFGSRLAALLLIALAVAGLAVASGASSWTSLVVGMLLVGATSGAADVAINTVSGQVEHDSACPVLTRAHGVFSLAVVAASLTGGLVLSTLAGTGDGVGAASALTWTFGVAAAVISLLCAFIWTGTRFNRARPSSLAWGNATAQESATKPKQATDSTPAADRRSRSARLHLTPLVVVGLVGALAYGVENAHQSWGAVFLSDTFTASAQTASLAPAAFAAAAALARLVLAPLSRTHPVPLLLTGGVLAATGSLVVATSTSVVVALVGLGVAAVGTATLFPTLLSTSLRHVRTGDRGRATSAVSTTAYLGFLLGPAYVGLLAEHVGLRGALIGVAVVAAVFTVAAVPVSRAFWRLTDE
ncbi:MFS transporter [Kineococcus sp. NBC_00420]|uniref:MFS transporter n=1 Tax=Kineococcus sp. NBC_00420 TaxID=2903564 RepID=UPI002E1F55AE